MNVLRVALLCLVLCSSGILSPTPVPAQAPQLSITNAQGEIVVFWPGALTNWVLEQANGLQPIWSRLSPGLYQTNNEGRSARMSQSKPQQFFRLRNVGAPIPGLTGYWQLDEGAGTSVGEATGNAALLSLSNTTWTTGRIGPGALLFNGASMSAGGSRVWVSNTNYRVLPPAGQPFSVSLWFRPSALTVGSRGIMGNQTNSTGWLVALRTPGPGTNDFVFSSAGGSLSVTGRTLLLPGQWHQLTVTHDGVAGSIYLDNRLVGRGNGSLPTHAGPVFFGGGIGGFDSFLGSLDDIRVYTNALSLEQVTLKGHWRFEESSGSFCTDESLNGQHAMLIDPAARTTGYSGQGVNLGTGVVILANDDYNVLPASGGAFSFGCWVRPQNLAAGRYGVMSCGNGASNGWFLAAVVESPGTARLQLVSTNTGGTLDLWTPTVLTNGLWSRVDVTFNGGLANAYVNGRKVGTATGGIRGSRSPLLLGTAPGAANFPGVIDELKIHSRERDAFEIGPVAATMWETVFINSSSNFTLQGMGPPGRTLNYSIVSNLTPALGTLIHSNGLVTVTFQTGVQKGPAVFTYTVNDGEFTSEPAVVTLSVVKPHWLAPGGGTTPPLDGTSPARAWAAGTAAALDDIWRTNNFYDAFLYAPGEFQTRGWKAQERQTANPGCKHIGAGSTGTNATTIKLVDVWDAWIEGFIFGEGACDGFEVHNLVLDCNGNGVPKTTVGEPIWLNIPLTSTARVDSVTLRWSQAYLAGTQRAGRAAAFKVCSRLYPTNAYTCTSLVSTGLVDVVPVGVEAGELQLWMEQREPGAAFYGLTEVEVTGNSASVPRALIPGGGVSRLGDVHAIFSAVDGRPSSWWASGPESMVSITLPFAPGTTIGQLNLHWHCQTLLTNRVGPAATFLIRARNEATGQMYDVPFTQQPRTAAGLQVCTFAPLATDQLEVLLTSKEAGVNAYALKEVTMQYGQSPVSIRQPSVLRYLDAGDPGHMAWRAFDTNAATLWASGTQGMVGAIFLYGNNLKFTNLRIIRFGTKPWRECFPMFLLATATGQPRKLGNVLVEDCVFTDSATNNNDGVTVLFLAAMPPNTLTNAVIRRCTVSGMRSQFGYSHAFAAVHVEDCLVQDCGTAVYFEPDKRAAEDIGHVFIRSNRFINVDYGLDVNSHPMAEFDSITFLDNEVVLNNANGWGLRVCDVCATGTNGTVTNVTVLNNIIRYPAWVTQPARPEGGLTYTDMRHAVFGNNVIALDTANALRVRQCPAGLIPAPTPVLDCNVQDPGPPGVNTYPPCVDALRPGYQRAWYNNRNLSGALLPMRFMNNGVDGLSSQQQWEE